MHAGAECQSIRGLHLPPCTTQQCGTHSPAREGLCALVRPSPGGDVGVVVQVANGRGGADTVDLGLQGPGGKSGVIQDLWAVGRKGCMFEGKTCMKEVCV
jgi:hypothetical protein